MKFQRMSHQVNNGSNNNGNGKQFKKKFYPRAPNDGGSKYTLSMGGSIRSWKTFLKNKTEALHPKLSPMFDLENPVDVIVSERSSNTTLGRNEVTVCVLPSERILTYTKAGTEPMLFGILLKFCDMVKKYEYKKNMSMLKQVSDH